MKKGGFLRNVLDTIRSNQTNQAGGPANPAGVQTARASDFGGLLKPHHFCLGQVARHGFPEQPSALAFDPVQKIAAIGTKSGALRVFGRPGVDVWAEHKPEFAVTHIRFVVNQGAIITVTADESIHLWSLRGPKLKLQLSTQTSCAPAASPSSVSSSSQVGQHQHHQQADGDAQPGDPDYLLLASERLADELEPGTGVQAGSGKGRLALAKESRQPELLHTLKFQREHITCLHQTLMSKWLYIGTERGNVHVANIETFELSGYQIAWNKAIELSRKTHPGAIIHISECPQDSNKLLLGYESGCIVLWDLKNKSADGRYYQSENLLWLAWHYEGKQFVGAHSDGSLVTWQTRSNARPSQTLQPHAKTSAPCPYPISTSALGEQPHQDNALSSSTCTSSSTPPSSSLSHHGQQQSSFARALNNEFYQPILKVDWRTSKSNEQFLLFSGGLPYDGPANGRANGQPNASSPLGRLPPNANPLAANQQSGNQYLRTSTTPSAPSPSATSATSGSSSPNERASSAIGASGGRQSACSPGPARLTSKASSFRPTALTVMLGKSITVLEMDDFIVDFITVSDSSPYDNDTSDPYAIIVLLANDLILIDLTSPGYPSFESPYPSSQLNESPVTCVQYLADCSSDLIPYLYSTSKNFISRAPKKGFSDKEWPINGGEWGQSMQSYPELVLTGHADGTIKFWDMSGVNFDLISKLKTSKLFERPKKPANSSVILPFSSFASQQLLASQAAQAQPHQDALTQGELGDLQISQLAQVNEENLFAVEKLEYCSASKRLLVAGASSHVIQFKLSKQQLQPQQQQPQQLQQPQQQQQPQHQSGSSSGNLELTSILVEQAQVKRQQHLLFKARNPNSSIVSSSSSSSASSTNRAKRSASESGFQAELICLTPMQVLNMDKEAETSGCYCIAPPKVTGLALQKEHNILAYTHENGVVLVDLVQKCVIMNATMSDLYGGSNSIIVANRDISIQPFATSSILQHHYQSVAAAANSLSPSSISSNPNIADPVGNLSRLNQHQTGNHNSTQAHSDNAARSDHNDNAEPADQVSANTVSSQPRNSVFQRQLSQSALGTLSSARISGQPKSGQRALFQRQMTASQLLASSSPTAPLSNAASQQNLAAQSSQSGSKQRGSGAPSTTKNKRIISRMLSISAIHTGSSLLSSQNDSLADSEPVGCKPAAHLANGGSSIIQSAVTLSAAEQQPDKIDSSFTRSRSSSGSSNTQHQHQLDSTCAETILCLCFHDYTAHSQYRSFPLDASSTASKSSPADPASGAQIALWLGTSHGCVLLVCLTMPDNEDNRVLQLQSVIAEPIPQAAVKLPGSIKCLSTFTSEIQNGRGQLMSSSGLSSTNQSSSLESDTATPSQSTSSNRSSPQQHTLGSGSSSLDQSRAAFLAVVSSKQALIYQLPCSPATSKPLSAYNSAASGSSLSSSQDHHHFLPSLHAHSAHSKEHPAGGLSEWPLAKLLLSSSQKDSSSGYCVARVELSDTSVSCRSSIVQMRHPDESCLVSFLATGSLVVHSLPALRPLMDTDFVACSSAKIGASMCMSRQGHCLYQPSSSEICKFTISAQYKALINDMTGLLYVAREMPEVPRTNFFKSLFGSVASSAASKQSDRDELFGECSAGKALRGVAKHIGSTATTAAGSNPGGLDKLKGATMGAMGHDMRLAREGLDERGEKLSEIEDRTFQMMHQSESYAQTAHQLAQKFKDKKWYQF